eukprot:gene13223-15625_t
MQNINANLMVQHAGYANTTNGSNDNGAATLLDNIYNRSNTLPLFAAGLHGEGQIVGVGDSGLDLSSCFFSDSANGNIPGPDHRKVIGYRSDFADDRDDLGHGTHVS